MVTTKKTPAQLRWEKRKAKVNKARRNKRKAARLAREKTMVGVEAANIRANRIIAPNTRTARLVAAKKADTDATLNKALYGDSNAAPALDNPDTIRAKAWASLGRKKGGIEKVANEVTRMIADARVEGGAAALANVSTRERHTRAINDERIVSAFIARMQVAEAALGTGLPPAIVISGLECAKIVDALRSAGYSNTSRHRNSPADIEKMMGKAHSEVRYAT